MHRLLKLFALAALALSLQACASITNGSMQAVTVITSPVQQAQCTLSNDRGQWVVSHTPSTISVHRASVSLNVQCRTASGYTGSAYANASTGGAFYGNLIAGGVVGLATDISSGAAYEYPAQITVVMKAPTGSEGVPGLPLPPATPPPVVTAAPAAPAGPQAARRQPAAPAESGLCYLPDGRSLRLGQDDCNAQSGIIGA